MRKPDRRTEATTKVCKDCGKRKSLDQFYKTSYARKYGTNSRMPYCIPCYSKRGKAYYLANSERMNERSKASRDRRITADPEAFRRSRNNIVLRRQYGLTLDEVEALVEKQDGKCMICQKALEMKNGKKQYGVDHDHACCPGERSCGQCIRGILCHRCNWAIGLLDDDPRRLRRAALYLESSERPRPKTAVG